MRDSLRKLFVIFCVLWLVLGAACTAFAQGVATKHLTITIAAAVSSTKTWTWLQDMPIIFCGQNGSTNHCNIGSGQFAPTTAGSVWVIQIQTVNNVTIQSVTGGGGTWVLCGNCHTFNAAGLNVDAAYNLTGTGGTANGITVNLSGVSGSSGINTNFWEALPPAGETASLDDSGSVGRTSCTTCTSVQLNNISATDIIFHNPGGAAQSTWNSWSAPYTTDINGGAYSINTVDGTAPTVVFTGSSNPTFVALAFKSTAGVFTPPTPQYSIVQFKNILQTCSPTCSLTWPQATAAGHLLFVMASNLNNDHITVASNGGTWVIPSGANTCQIFYVQAGNNAFSCAYVLSSTAGATTISVTLNGTSSTGFGIWEIATTNGSFVLDTQDSHVNAASFAPSGQALTLTGTNDVIFQGGFVPGGAAGVTAYPQTYLLSPGSGYILLNEASEAALLDSGPTPQTPVWVNPQNNTTSAFGIAFKTVNAVYTAATCLEADVQAAYTTEQASKVDGDIISIPACPGGVVWSSSWSISPTNSLTFKGAGDTSQGGGDQTVIIDNVSHTPTDNPTWQITTTAGKTYRLTGITFSKNGSSSTSFNGALRLAGNSSKFRLDHMHSAWSNHGKQITLSGCVYGVMDNSVVDLPVGGTFNALFFDQGTCGGDATNVGNGQWNIATNLGTPNFFYVENTTFNGGTNPAGGGSTVIPFVDDCSGGGRFVLRFNSINGAAVQGHATGHSNNPPDRSCRAYEVYQNVFGSPSTTSTTNPAFDSFFNTGGTGVDWGNTVTGFYQQFIHGDVDRTNNITYTQSATPSGWGYCNTSPVGGVAGPSNWDGASAYPCLDSIGRGAGDLLQGSFPNVCDVTANDCANSIFTGRWPNQAQEPVYEWLNKWQAVPGWTSLFWAQIGGSVSQNRDYYLYTLTWNGSSFTGTAFNGTVGTGSGTLAARPATCTTGVAYWVTNEGLWNQSGGPQGRLYICGPTDTWSLYYTPYTYPHPLVM